MADPTAFIMPQPFPGEDTECFLLRSLLFFDAYFRYVSNERPKVLDTHLGEMFDAFASAVKPYITGDPGRIAKLQACFRYVQSIAEAFLNKQ